MEIPLYGFLKVIIRLFLLRFSLFSRLLKYFIGHEVTHRASLLYSLYSNLSIDLPLWYYFNTFLL